MGGDATFFTGVPLPVSVENYDIASNSWTYGDSVVTKAAAPSGGLAGGKAMVQGGVDSTTYCDLVQGAPVNCEGGTPTPTATATPTATPTATANSDSHTYIDGNGYRNADIYCYRGAEVYGDAQAASHAGPTPIMSLVSRLSAGTRERASRVLSSAGLGRQRFSFASL